MAWMRAIQSARSILGTATPSSNLTIPRFYSKPALYAVKVGIPEFLSGIGGGAETHIAKLETEIGDQGWLEVFGDLKHFIKMWPFNTVAGTVGDLPKLLVTRTLRLKKFGISCKHRKLILKYSQKYRLGLWRPRADAIKA